MRIAYNEINSSIAAALENRGLTARVALQPIEPPRPWGVTSNACFTLGAQYAAAEIETATTGLDKKAAKETAGRLAREAGIKLAQEVAAELEECRAAGGLTQYIARVEAEGAYLNFYYDACALAELVIAVAGMQDYTPDDANDNFGSGTVPYDQRKQIMVEYAQPNTHKDFHVGHLRNASIGQAIANLLEFSGHTVYKATYLGDVGAHVAKAIRSEEHYLAQDYAAAAGFYKFELDPNNTLHYWGILYQEYGRFLDFLKGHLQEQTTGPTGEFPIPWIAFEDLQLRKWLSDLELGDEHTVAKWQETRDECVSAFHQLFVEMKVEFTPDCVFFESTVGGQAHLDKTAATELHRRSIAVVDDSEEYKGALYVDFAAQADAPVFSDQEKKRIRQLGKMTILRSNGTSLYQTKELGLAKYKFDWVKEQTGRDLDESLYVVGAEQKLYFEQVFAILRLWGFPNADKCKHIAYELVVLPEGKMSSREGTVVSYRELRDAAVEQATQIIREKGLITDEAQIAQTAKAVAIAAIKYTMLQVSGNQQIVFDFTQALSFDGRSAPYLQYAYARAGKLVLEDKQPSAVRDPQSTEPVGGESATADSGQRTTDKVHDLHPSETALARLLSQFPETCETAAARYEPAVLCNYLYACADAFSAFYRDCRVLGAPELERSFRQGLVRAFRRVMKTGFDILALPLPETM